MSNSETDSENPHFLNNTTIDKMETEIREKQESAAGKSLVAKTYSHTIKFALDAVEYKKMV